MLLFRITKLYISKATISCLGFFIMAQQLYSQNIPLEKLAASYARTETVFDCEQINDSIFVMALLKNPKDGQYNSTFFNSLDSFTTSFITFNVKSNTQKITKMIGSVDTFSYYLAFTMFAFKDNIYFLRKNMPRANFTPSFDTDNNYPIELCQIRNQTISKVCDIQYGQNSGDYDYFILPNLDSQIVILHPIPNFGIPVFSRLGVYDFSGNRLHLSDTISHVDLVRGIIQNSLDSSYNLMLSLTSAYYKLPKNLTSFKKIPLIDTSKLGRINFKSYVNNGNSDQFRPISEYNPTVLPNFYYLNKFRIVNDSIVQYLWQKNIGANPKFEYGYHDQASIGRYDYFAYGDKRCELFFHPPAICSNNVILSKTDTLGTTLWEKTIGGDASYLVSKMVATKDSGCLAILLRYEYPLNNREHDTYYLYFDKNGNPIQNYLPTNTKQNFQIPVYDKPILYPNPSTNFIKLKNASFFKEIVSTQIFTLNGKLLSTTKFQERTDISSLASGSYLYKLVDKEKRKYSTQFVKE